MPGLVPGIHVFAATKVVDGRVKPGHDDDAEQLCRETGFGQQNKTAKTTPCTVAAPLAALCFF
ncbi:hypothetical protein [Bradyrhizobium glycinis]|uniref:hypothetical protein n=1 Tax=Bradyrhizobium glycinis TaxID=2751812 RepID=UPI001FE95C29|nr:hypothetical protein [Bradyrhizobium glycinis]